MSDRQFRGIWIPVHIWETSDLTAAERCLWAEIDSFTSNNGNGYYKTNQQASEELGVSQRQVSRAFAKLESMGLISVTKKGVRRVAKSTPWRDVLDSVASNPRHDGEVSSPQWRGIKNKEKNNKKHNENTLVYAIEGDEMKELWKVWCRERKAFVKGQYTPYAQQKAMNKLQRLCNENIEQARKIIDQSITNAWKTFYPVREDFNKQRPKLDAKQALEWATGKST